MNREQLIKFIPKPTNQDVILYDISLKNLIDIDVLEEYNKLLPQFKYKQEEYLYLKRKIKEYEESINKIYLYKTNWTEADYLQALQNDKKTYSILYNDIKKTENNIIMLQKKIKNMNEKIEMQIALEKRKNDIKKENIDNEIAANKAKLLKLRDTLSLYEQDLNKVNELIADNEEEFNMLVEMEKDLKAKKFKCKYCGAVVLDTSEDSFIVKRLYKNLEKNKSELKSLLKKKEKLELNISYYESEASTIRTNLNNNIQFKKQDYNFYQKKSLDVLKLEALRDEMINNIDKLENSLKNNPQLKSDKYTELKKKIDNLELSLSNLTRIKEMKESLKAGIDKFNYLKKELLLMKDSMDQYKKFLTIYFKIYEQKANEYFGQYFKFRLFKFNDYDLTDIFEVYYNNVEYSQLSIKDKNEVDKIFIEKFSIYL